MSRYVTAAKTGLGEQLDTRKRAADLVTRRPCVARLFIPGDFEDPRLKAAPYFDEARRSDEKSL